MDILLVYKRPRPEDLKIHDAALSHVEHILKTKNLSFEICYRENLEPGLIRDQLIITVGGDGTLLETSHYVQDNIILGVNSNPVSSVGSLCVADTNSFEFILERYLSGDLKPIPATRIQATLDNRVLPALALNDILIANPNPAAMTRYWIEVDGQEALHKNSGLWISTACGSTGAIASSGGHVQKINDNRLQWMCREPYFAKHPIPTLLTGFLQKGHVIKLTSSMAEGRIFIDGPHLQEPFNQGQELVLSASNCHLNWLMTPDMELRRQEIGLLREHYEFKRRHESPSV
jgi:NAD+ kinase